MMRSTRHSIIASIACPLARQEKIPSPFPIAFSDLKMMDVLFSRYFD
jgi:hypothetical protein